MHALIAGISNRLDCPVLAVGGTADHVHVLYTLARTMSPADWVREVKRVSSIEWKRLSNHPQDFAWQHGYGQFSVSVSQLKVVQRYIQNQEEHHRRRDFKDEFRALLLNHGVEWDEQYMWE